MRREPKHIILCFVVALVTCSSCLDEPFRGNSLDPQSPDFTNAGSIRGVVQNRALSGIAGAQVVILPVQLATTTQSDGTYLYPSVPVGRYSIQVMEAGYERVVDSVRVVLGSETEKNLQMNGLPFVEEVAATTSHISRWWPQDDLYRIDVQASVGDVDGLIDIKSVTLTIPSVGVQDTLLTGQNPGEFRTTLFEQDLGGSVQSILGNEIVLTLEDQTGTQVTLDGIFLVRVIEEVPVATSPLALETVISDQPNLTWEPLSLPFQFTQTIVVTRVDDDVNTVVQTHEKISHSTTNVVVGESLAAGEYYWTISVVDDFGNSSRSKQSGFVVP